MSAAQVIQDGDNKVKVTLPNEDEFIFEAIGDKLIVMYDTAKSGFECKVCKGKGIVPNGERFSIITEKWEIDFRDCDECKGKGALLVLPQSAVSLPTTGMIVSVGPLCTAAHSKLAYRVVFAPHVGTMIPMKNNVKLKIMRENDVLCTMASSLEDFTTNDFMDFEEH